MGLVTVLSLPRDRFATKKLSKARAIFKILGALESWGRALSNAPKIIKIASRITHLQFKTSGSMLILSPLYW